MPNQAGPSGRPESPRPCRFVLDGIGTDVAVECARAFLEVTAEDPDETQAIDQIRDL